MASDYSISKKIELGVLIVVSGLLAVWLKVSHPVADNKERAVVEQETVVAGFPQVPVFPEAKLINSYKKSDQTRVGYEGHWTTQEPVAEVMKWYLSALRDDGWQITSPPEDPEADGEQFAVVRNDDWVLNLIVEDEDGVGTTDIEVEFPVR